MTTANAYLNDRLAFYTPPSTYFDAARGHRAQIEKRLDDAFGVKEMFETGSLRAGTGVRFYSDADYLVCLKGERPVTGTSALTKVKTSLAERFTTTVVQVRSPAVVCQFGGGTETVEVVPAYTEGSGFWIPDPATGGWMKTHPKDHNAYVNEVNKKHSGGAKKLARIAKVWKYKQNVPISSCYLEMRAAKYADKQSSWWLPADLHGFLQHLDSISLAAMNDPTGLGSRFTPCSSNSKKTDALSKLSTAVARAGKAWDYDRDDKDELAVAQLKLLLNQ
jgi:hypothetical protein